MKYGHDLYTPSDSSDNAIDNYYLIRGKLAEDDPLKTRKVGGLHGYHIVHIDKHNDKMLHYLKSFNFRALVNEEELLVDYDDHGEAAATSISKQQVEEIISGVSSEAWLQHLTELVSFGSRNIFDDRINQSVDYLIGKFQQYGYKPKVESCHDAVELQTMAGGKTFVAKNVYAYKEGSKYPDEFIVMGAHYDDMPDNHQSAPGADDNGE